jgi:hypothetical protein
VRGVYLLRVLLRARRVVDLAQARLLHHLEAAHVLLLALVEPLLRAHHHQLRRALRVLLAHLLELLHAARRHRAGEGVLGRHHLHQPRRLLRVLLPLGAVRRRRSRLALRVVRLVERTPARW